LSEGFEFLEPFRLFFGLVLFGTFIGELGQAFKVVNDSAET
jgi:hypothetical protein